MPKQNHRERKKTSKVQIAIIFIQIESMARPVCSGRLRIQQSITVDTESDDFVFIWCRLVDITFNKCHHDCYYYHHYYWLSVRCLSFAQSFAVHIVLENYNRFFPVALTSPSCSFAHIQFSRLCSAQRHSHNAPDNIISL